MPRKKKEEAVKEAVEQDIMEVPDDFSDSFGDDKGDMLTGMLGQAPAMPAVRAGGKSEKQKTEEEQQKAIEEIAKRLKKEGTLNAYKKPLTPLTSEEMQKAEEERLTRLKKMKNQGDAPDEAASEASKTETSEAEASVKKGNTEEPVESGDSRESNKYEVTGILDIAEGGFGFLRVGKWSGGRLQRGSSGAF